MDKSLNQGMFTAKNNEPVSVGHPQIDNLNRQFGVNLIKPMLHELYQLPAKGNLRTAQHREHGLHLWYELGLDEHTDVVAGHGAVISQNSWGYDHRCAGRRSEPDEHRIHELGHWHILRHTLRYFLQ